MMLHKVFHDRHGALEGLATLQQEGSDFHAALVGTAMLPRFLH